MSKIRTLIVEDEPRMARFLENLTTKAGFFVLAVCENCEAAMEVLKNDVCDLLITDINMPDQSGLDLIRWAKVECPHLRVMIVSGHKDFAYAKEAIRLKVDYYITKPISQEEFFSALNQIRERTRQEKQSQTQKQFANALERCDVGTLKVLFPWKYCSILAVYEKEFVPDQAIIGDSALANCLTFHNRNIRYVLLGKFKQKEDVDVDLIQWGQRLMQESSCKTCCVLVVRGVEIDADLLEKIHLAERNLQACTFLGKKNLHQQDSLTEVDAIEKIPDEHTIRRIKAEIYTRNIGRLKQEFANLLAIWENNRASMFYISRQLRFLAEKMERNLPHGGNGGIRERFLEILRAADDYVAFAQKLLPQIDAGFLEAASMEKRKKNNAEQTFLKIKQLLEENEEENYSLQEICQIFQLSQPYVRSLFKQFAGKGFKEYILDEKISLAKQIMLADPAILVKDVAQRIGFEQMYFATVFSKYTGMTPSSFKQAMEGNVQQEGDE